MIHSLRFRLLLSTSLASALILTLLGFSVYGFMWHRLLGEFDANQITKARTIAAMVEMNGSTVSFDADLDQMPEFSAKRNPEFFEIYLADGTVLARSASLGTRDFHPAGAETNPAADDVLLPNGRRGRSITLSFVVHPEHDGNEPAPATPQTATVVLAARPIEVNHALEDLSWLLTILCAAAVMLCGIVLYKIAGRVVAPVNRLASDIDLLDQIDLSRRLNPGAVPSELSPVVDKLNGLLARLDQSFARERAFTADVAHELRTPLAGIQTTLEVCRSRPRQSAEYEATLDDCRAMTDRLQAMIENLLLLARADAGQLPLNPQAFDLSQLMQECWQPLLARASERRLTIQESINGDSQIILDADKLRIILRNLLDNAVTYANEGGSIRWTIQRMINQTEEKLQIVVSNSGSQVRQEDALKLFDRFYRADSSRTDTGVHCGLGLSLCQRLIEILGGQLRIKTSEGKEFIATLEI